MAPRVVLRLTHIVKSYPGVRALKGVSLEVTAGEVHALVGENGAGKSTLMGVAAGAVEPDSGGVEIAGTVLDSASPARAAALGISVVYQQPAILDDLTVKENLLFSVPRDRRGRQGTSAWVAKQLVSIGANFDTEARASELSLSQRQLLELAEAVASDPKVLVLDEPTEALTHVETERLFEMIERIRQSGTAVVYISHRLPDVKRVADRVTVLRDGETRGTFVSREISEDEILRLIIGRSVDRAFPAKPQVRRNADRTNRLEARRLRSDALTGVSLSIAPGEIVGFAGVDGNGQRECIRALAGLEVATGDVLLDGRRVNPVTETRRSHGGIVYMPAERHAEGLFMSLSVRENLTSLALSRLARFGIVSPSREERLVNTAVEELAIKVPSPEERVSFLSGGNQQKVLFARSLARQPAVLLADEPTRGVDAGARLELYRILREAADGGAAVAVCSSDAIELEGLCDRVLVFSRGAIVADLAGNDASEERITGAAITHERQGTGDCERRGDEQRRRLRRFLEGDYMPSLVIALLIAALAIYVNASNSFFLGSRNINGVLFLAAALGFASIAQLVVVLTGGVDLAVGPLAGLVVVVLSFFAGAMESTGSVISGLLLAFVISVGVGLVHGLLIRKVGLSPVVTTLATYIGLQGVSLTLRPTPTGYVGPDFGNVLEQKIGPIPAAFVVLAVVAIVAEIVLRRSRPGIGLRAAGSDGVSAHRLGARVNLLVIGAYVLASIFAGAAGVLLAAQVGIGDPTVGITYTFQSISAVVLGGISIFGGRGSFISTVLAAVLLQELTSATQFLGLSTAWQYWFPGLIILLAAALYSGARDTSGARHPVAVALAQLGSVIRRPPEPGRSGPDQAGTEEPTLDTKPVA
jgi:ribose transport system permease protein/ribose transport system ATP-binding protein